MVVRVRRMKVHVSKLLKVPSLHNFSNINKELNGGEIHILHLSLPANQIWNVMVSDLAYMSGFCQLKSKREGKCLLMYQEV